MKCPFCSSDNTRVIDSRPADDNSSIRRRRLCDDCGKRFTTYETVETTPVLVVKANGTRQAFDINKIKNGIIKACEKRPVPASKIEKLTDDIQKKVYNSMAQEVSSKDLGEMVMEGLKEIDEVAYIRFASVYRSFTDISSFMKEVENIVKNKDK